MVTQELHRHMVATLESALLDTGCVRTDEGRS